MKHWTKEALQNEFKRLSDQSNRVSTEFQMGFPDEGVCDRLLKQMWSKIGEILRQRKEHGWPRE